MFWGLLFIAIGVGALLDISIWPLVFIAVGVATLLPALAAWLSSGSPPTSP
jgi:hypothetical protein